MTMNNNFSTDEHFSSSDLALVTTLSLFFPIETIDQVRPNKSFFLFRRQEHLNKLIEQYWRGEIRVEPQAYFTQLKRIKARLYDTQ